MFDGKDLHLDAAPPTAARAAGWGTGAMVVVGASLAGPDGALLRAERVELTARLRREIRAGRFSPAHTVFFATESLDFQVRQRRAGDAYRPLGAPGRASLQDLLVNRKIPRAARDRLPVVCDAAGQPLWVPGLPPADEMAVQRGTKLVVQLTYIPPGAIVPIP
jgi:tRNA(Ile)-lysidine synthetase-like protein